jgi:hypothetical protein
MKTEYIQTKGTWTDVVNSARTTVGKEAVGKEPSDQWKRRILLAEHSPIRKIIIEWKWRDLLWWVQTHYTRHHVGVEWFVETSREDRTGVNRKGLSQDALINVGGEANAQAIINISRKRLCFCASKETREAWESFLETIKDKEPQLYSVCVRDCIFRGHCYEMNSCGWYKSESFKKQLAEYREGINN